jgi:hypothetical protein
MPAPPLWREEVFPGFDGGLVSQPDRQPPGECLLRQADNLWRRPDGLRTRPSVKAVSRFSRRQGTLEPLRQVEQTTGYSWWVEAFTQNGAAALQLFRLDADGRQITVGDPLAVSYAVITPTVSGWLAIADNHVYRLTGGQGAWINADGDIHIPVIRRGCRGCLPTEVQPLAGREHEELNHLTDRFSVDYTTDGESPRFYLPYSGLDDGEVTAVLTTDTGQRLTYRVTAGQTDSAPADGRYMRVSRAGGYVQFRSALWDDQDDPPPVSGREDNLRITAAKAGISGNLTRRMRQGAWLTGDDRRATLVLTGNAFDSSLICWSAAGDPLYFPASHTARVGDPQGYISAIQPLRDRLLLFKKSCIYMLTATTAIGAEPEKVYVTLYPSATGCDRPQTICMGDDRLFWVDTHGRVRSLSFSQMTTRQPPELLSTAITDPLREALTAAGSDTAAVWWRGQYLLRVGGAIWTFSPGKRPAWGRWTLDGRLSPDRMAVVGDRAELLCRDQNGGQATWVVCHLSDDESGEDRLEIGGQTVNAPIAYAAATTLWDVKAPDRKRMDAAALDADLPPGQALVLHFDTEWGAAERLRLTPGQSGGHWLPFRLSRFSRLAVRFAGKGFLRIRRLRIRVR